MIKLTVQEMACGGCVKSIKEALTALDGSVNVNADLESGTVEVTSSAEPEAIRAAIEEAGFPAQLA
ncbi:MULTISPECIES: heavy-metal-associated domain-containing protein [Cohaesibacter]|uniref:heavy-metal-associated domain-containing protein n=1 Tax=Cohaesibacter TaxID=655352 RepID=UPI000DEBC794|nr:MULTISPECIES: cation transporter [Cohaesibacter]TLP45594.1 heavy-metal-associated domain-containing protein [Cohaesibacter sp. CAU 1516]